MNSEPKPPSPGLARGIAILRLLENLLPMAPGLHEISSELALPKASCLRLLETLEAEGLVVRQPDKRYRALVRLTPLSDDHFQHRLRRTMDQLTTATKATVEWWTVDRTGGTLTEQIQPEEGEVRVVAQAGFKRPWNTELEAVTCVAHAFGSGVPKAGKTHRYCADGTLEELSAAAASTWIQATRKTGMAMDDYYNANGVKRYAAPVFQDGVFRGILAIAESFAFKSQPDFAVILHQHLNLENRDENTLY